MRGFFVLVLLTTAAPTVASADERVSDPFEGFNRAMFGVNEALDKALLEPAAKGYRAVTPTPVRSGVRNFLRNLKSPVILANDVLQAEPKRAGTTFLRFGVNTTIGVVGLFDVATPMGLERHDEDFGQTLGKWGVGSGPYLFLPIIGPTSIRDGVGSIADVAMDPINYARFDGDDAFRISRAVLGGLTARTDAIETIDNLRETSLDPYVTVRSTYSLYRAAAIKNGRTDVQNLPDFDEIPPAPGEPPAAPAPEAAPLPEGAVK
jgi:phospholipid-binding lipoprotein MlaA